MNEYFACFGLPGTFVLTWLISLIAVILALLRRKTYAYFCAAGMVVSSCGDMFMTRFGNIPEIFPNYFIIGASLFMAAHVLYIISYRLLAKSKGYRYFNGGVIAAIAIALACLIYFTVICCQRNDFSMYVLCMIYLAVITVNCAAIFSYAWSSAKKQPYLILCAVGALSFFFSDFIIGLDALAGIYDYGYLIWWLYPIGQILLNVFAF
ncbi:MAG: hypothetical protein IKZ09_00180 [Clostridia bacterium]|nr:hypothetical protein [Clostridia bacterium]